MDLDKFLDCYPHIFHQIASKLTIHALLNCRCVNSKWKQVIDLQKYAWIKKVQYFLELRHWQEETLEWNKILKTFSLQNLIQIGELAHTYCQDDPRLRQIKDECYLRSMKRYLKRDPRSALHLATMIGNVRLFQSTFHLSYFKNPSDGQNTPLHIAATRGCVEMCQLIIENIKLKKRNPIDNKDNEWTPLHYAVQNNHYQGI